MGQTDDDGFDGLVYLRLAKANPERPLDRRAWTHEFTGGLIHVQVKTGDSFVGTNQGDHFEIKIKDIHKKRQIWEKSPLPVALVYVKSEKPGRKPRKAWWANLKDPSSYKTNGTVIVFLKNRFEEGLECRSPFSKLARHQQRHVGLEQIDMTLEQKNKGMSLAITPKYFAWNFYREWKASEVLNPILGPIIVNRTGWSHITRPGRPVSRILASFNLLPAAAEIVEKVKSWRKLRRGQEVRQYSDESWGVYEYIGLSAMVRWPARAPSEVMVILRRLNRFRRSTSDDDAVVLIETKTWFYSVYEPGRRKSTN